MTSAFSRCCTGDFVTAKTWKSKLGTTFDRPALVILAQSVHATFTGTVIAMSDLYDEEHEAFAASRSTKYVYAATRDTFFTMLDQHADTLEGDVKPPLVILGAEGSGKSALLANWVAKRRIIKHRDEFLFQHFVGCSAQSCELSHMLLRLETALKDFFQLREMEVPDSEERLRWSLNRFLGAAAKKHSPARIVIIIDGVNNVKGEGGRDGELYWLPTDLPPCVRFIVSSVEQDRGVKSMDEVALHRTYVELARRQCPMIRMEPLTVPTRHTIINAFCELNPGSLDLMENHRFKIVAAQASAQPLFLRSLLQSLRLGLQVTSSDIDTLLDMFLKCNTAFELIERNLNMCSHPYPDADINEEFAEMLRKMMTVLYVSRNGLSEDELWGVIKMVSKMDPNEELKHTDKLTLILKDFTMTVGGLNSFSHEIYREVVYEKFISSQEDLVRWHVLMSKFFGQLPPCDRKLVSLPYHLEVAGAWSKVKNCLTEIDMFDLWWTPKFKKEFIQLWTSLIARPGAGPGAGDNATLREISNKPRPTYDIVEEYVKSLDEFRSLHNPSDEKVADVILQIADFLIEFATLGQEMYADVPALIHPPVPSEDLCALGVPHIVNDEEGRSVLVTPFMGNKQDDVLKGLGDVPSKSANEDFPECTTYYFHRWMWIQFPLIALGNCGKRYLEGIKVRNKSNPWGETAANKKSSFQEINKESREKNTNKMLVKRTMTRTMSAASFKLPEIKFNRPAAKTMRRVPNPDAELDDGGVSDMVQRRVAALNDEIHTLRAEYDFMKQQRQVLSKRLTEVQAALTELERSEASMHMFDGALETAIKNDANGAKKLEHARLLHNNLKSLLVMCERHPAHCPAVIREVENKLEQDEYLIHEIKSRLWEQKFERQSHMSCFRQMKALVQQGVDMHTKLLEYRYEMKRHTQHQVMEDTNRLQERANSRHSFRGNNTVHQSRDPVEGDPANRLELESGSNSWDRMWRIISNRTGITDPDIFFQRLNNGGVLEEQMMSLKKSSESRLNALKNEVQIVEAELEEVRYEASFVGGVSRDTYQKHKELATVQQQLRRVKERTEGSEQLQQEVISGLNHISELLGVPEREENAPIGDLIRDIETVLDTLIEEREKQQQGQQTAATMHADTSPGHTRGILTRDGVSSPDPAHHRPPELELVLNKFEQPKARLAACLPSRPVDNTVQLSERDVDDDDMDEEGMWDRRFAKLRSTKNVRTQQKKAARQMRILEVPTIPANHSIMFEDISK